MFLVSLATSWNALRIVMRHSRVNVSCFDLLLVGML